MNTIKSKQLLDIKENQPDIIRTFLLQHVVSRNLSNLTLKEYSHDLAMFFRFLYIRNGKVSADTLIENVSIADLDAQFIRLVTTSDIYDFLEYLSTGRYIDFAREKNIKEFKSNRISATSMTRKISTLKSFFKYLKSKAYIIDVNPCENIDTIKKPKSLPKFLSLEEAQKLLLSVEGANSTRDYAILCIFLNTGIRLAELCSMDISSINFNDGSVRIIGKGNKERIVYFNDACIAAVREYLKVRPVDGVPDMHKKALFLSSTQKKRINRSTVQKITEKYLAAAGLAGRNLSTHKLRHTAATLMYQSGVDVRTLKDVLGHEQLNTTQIYTHVSNSQLKDASNLNPLASVKKK